MPFRHGLLLTLTLFLSLGHPLAAQTSRIWKSADGERTLEGEFLTLEEGQITLKLKDGKTTTFSIAKLSEEDRKFAQAENGKPKTELRDLLGAPSQAFDNIRFGMTRDAYETALSKSDHTQSVGGTEIEFFGQTVVLGDFLARIDGRSYQFRPHFENEILTDLRLEGTPVESAPESAIRARLGEMRTLVGVAFGDPAERFEFPDLPNLPENAFGITESWNLPGGRKLYLAVSRAEKGKLLACTLRITAK
jgi:hypothetical protein